MCPRSDHRYIVAGTKPWSRRVYDDVISKYPGEWHFIDRRDDLDRGRVAAIGPAFIFFLHWSWRVPLEIISAYSCVAFHMSAVPYGRGGSPLQNLILRGHRATKLSALRMVDVLDAGPVYLAEPLSLEGSAEEIYLRASRLAADMIARMTSEDLVPQPQRGEPTVFRRREPSESEIGNCGDLDALFDFIRMLDAETYPRAFLTHGGFRYEFSRVVRRHGHLVADVKITGADPKW